MASDLARPGRGLSPLADVDAVVTGGAPGETIIICPPGKAPEDVLASTHEMIRQIAAMPDPRARRSAARARRTLVTSVRVVRIEDVLVHRVRAKLGVIRRAGRSRAPRRRLAATHASRRAPPDPSPGRSSGWWRR